MNSLARQFFAKNKESPFQEVIFLDEKSSFSWEDLQQKVPHLPRGWFELSRIETRDRIEFTREHWLDRMPYHPKAHPLFFEFFEMLDDVGLVLFSRKGEPLQPQLVYSLADNSTFFRGNPPARETDLRGLKEEIEVPLPDDYLQFMRIHDGFGKLSEMGLLEVGDISYARRRVMDLILQSHRPIMYKGRIVDPSSLIPFYETLGLSSFQCFFSDFQEGNVYLSGIDYILSTELAFPTFSEWLAQYLQGIDLCLI
jgi:hypothetical protein